MEIIYEPKHMDSISALDTMYPTYATYYKEEADDLGMEYATTFGYVLTGKAVIYANRQLWQVYGRNYFAFSGEFSIDEAHDLNMWTVTKLGYKGMSMMGKVEEKGRLSYIDGCSDSILVPMPRRGDPVLNYLHFPQGINQTQHTHPSIRMGVVTEGSGEAFKQESWVKPLKKGCMFMLEEQELHSFRTTDDNMNIVAFHPDSDTGSTDEDHPMINRTYIR